MKLRLRLVLVLLLPLLLVIGVYSVVRVQQEARARVEEEQARAAGMARTIQIAVENALAVRGPQHPELVRLLDELTEGQPAVDQIRVVAKDGQILASSTPRAALGPPDPAAIARAIDTGLGSVDETRDLGRDWWVHTKPMKYLARPAGSRPSPRRVALQVMFAAPDPGKMATQAIGDVLVRVGVLVGALALLVALVLQREVLRPLARLAQSIRALGEGRRGPPLPVRRHDELGEVALAFNRMTERLDEARQRVAAEGEYALDLEQQLRRAETLAVAGKLASGIAHEVGTPLNIISGRAEMVLRSLPPDHEGREDLERIIHQIDRVSNIVRSLLDAVRVGKPEVQRVDLEMLIGRLIPLMDHVARKRGIALAARLPEDLPDVAADPGRLQQLFINLLMNAVEATPPEGRIDVEAWSCAHDGRAGVSVVVSDTGPGIPASALAQVFEPFYTTKPVGHGTGLGLAISRDIVRDHGGTIVAQSRPGQGATFTVWLPSHAEAA